jgi:hypothetical protein
LKREALKREALKREVFELARSAKSALNVSKRTGTASAGYETTRRGDQPFQLKRFRLSAKR